MAPSLTEAAPEVLTPTPPVVVGGPVWPVAELQPLQGEWTERDYLSLTATTSRLIELTDGDLEFLPMPSTKHQRLVAYLYRNLSKALGEGQDGEVLFAPLRIKVAEGKFREPDLVVMLAQNSGRKGEAFWTGADLVIEVVSPDDPQRDWEQKRLDYAAAGIAEYWIVDPQQRRVMVLTLAGGASAYAEHQDARPGDVATGRLLPDFAVEVEACFAAGD